MTKWRRIQRLLTIPLFIVCAFFVIADVVEHELSTRPLCAWCRSKLLYGEHTQVREFWIHDRCWSHLSFESGLVFNDIAGVETWTPERYDWIHNRLKERSCLWE